MIAMGKQKKNPQIILKESQLKKIKSECTNKAVNDALTIFLTVMNNKEGYGKTRIKRLYKRIEELSDTVSDGYVTIERLKKALEDECGIIIK